MAQRGRLIEGLRSMENAVRLRPNHAKSRNNLGVALAQANRPREAVDQLKKRIAESGRLRTDAQIEIHWAEAAAALGLEDPTPVPQLD